jgi:hypothetical protein
MNETKMAVSPKTARTNIEQAKAYQETFGESSEKLKESVGRLLLRLSAGREGQDGWQQFDRLLRQYVSLRHLGGVL